MAPLEATKSHNAAAVVALVKHGMQKSSVSGSDTSSTSDTLVEFLQSISHGTALPVRWSHTLTNGLLAYPPDACAFTQGAGVRHRGTHCTDLFVKSTCHLKQKVILHSRSKRAALPCIRQSYMLEPHVTLTRCHASIQIRGATTSCSNEMFCALDQGPTRDAQHRDPLG